MAQPFKAGDRRLGRVPSFWLDDGARHKPGLICRAALSAAGRPCRAGRDNHIFFNMICRISVSLSLTGKMRKPSVRAHSLWTGDLGAADFFWGVFNWLPLKGVELIILMTFVIFRIGDHLSSRQFIQQNFVLLRSNIDFYEPLFSIVIYAGLILCFVSVNVSRTTELERLGAARLLHWAQTEAAGGSPGPSAFDYEKLEHKIYASAQEISDTFAQIPSEDLAASLLGKLRPEKTNALMQTVLSRFGAILIAIAALTYAATAFQFAVNTFDAPVPRLGVVLILIVMASMLVLLTTFSPLVMNISADLLRRDL